MFDTVVMADWSAANAPSPARPSKDAIWIGVARGGRVDPPEYHRTRAAAAGRLATLLAQEADAGRRVLAGFDFPFGWPRGAARAWTGRDEGLAVWARLAALVEDGAANRSNRWDVAAALNAAFPGEGPFWGNGGAREVPGLSRTSPWRRGLAQPAGWPANWREAERAGAARTAGASAPKSCWQLAGAGSVGSQALLGVAALERLRRDPRLAGRCAVWPFETGLAAGDAPGDAPVVIAEIYPSLLAALVRRGTAALAETDREPIPDAVQVALCAAAFARMEDAARAALFAVGPGLPAPQVVAAEEAWILGLRAEDDGPRPCPALLAAAEAALPAVLDAVARALPPARRKSDRAAKGGPAMAGQQAEDHPAVTDAPTPARSPGAGSLNAVAAGAGRPEAVPTPRGATTVADAPRPSPSAPRPGPPAPPVHVVGIGEDGLDGLAPAVRALVASAGAILGGDRHPDLPVHGARLAWPEGWGDTLALIRARRGDRLVVLVHGDPLWFSAGARIARAMPGEAVFHPAVSSFQHAAARLGWSMADLEATSAHRGHVERVLPLIADGARILMISTGAETPGRLAAALVDRGWGPSRLTVFEAIGGPQERRIEATAEGWTGAAPDFTVTALECVAGPNALRRPRAQALPDSAFATPPALPELARAWILGRLRPVRGARLVARGAGAEAVAIDFARAAPDARAWAETADPEGFAAEALALGAVGAAPLSDAPGRVEAVFAGAGATAPEPTPAGAPVRTLVRVLPEGAPPPAGGEAVRLSAAPAQGGGWGAPATVALWASVAGPGDAD